MVFERGKLKPVIKRQAMTKTDTWRQALEGNLLALLRRWTKNEAANKNKKGVRGRKVRSFLTTKLLINTKYTKGKMDSRTISLERP
jgi:hypothetical protein